MNIKRKIIESFKTQTVQDHMDPINNQIKDAIYEVLATQIKDSDIIDDIIDRANMTEKESDTATRIIAIVDSIKDQDVYELNSLRDKDWGKLSDKLYYILGGKNESRFNRLLRTLLNEANSNYQYDKKYEDVYSLVTYE